MDPHGFDEWYSAMSASPRHAAIHQQTLGLPPELESSSLLPWDGIEDLVTALGIGCGDLVVDLACGRGGYGLEVARRTGASLVGVDFSAVAVARAGQRHAESWQDIRADFRVGELAATGLADGRAAAVMCVDAMQFGDPYPAGFTECGRALAPGGRLAVTGWEADDPDDETIPARLRHDIGATMAACGFCDVRVREMTSWQRSERKLWQAAIATEPDDDPAMTSMRNEGSRVLGWIDRSRRVLVTGRAAA